MRVCACVHGCACVMLQVTQTEVERLKSSYMQTVRDAAQAKRKFQEASKGEGSRLSHIGFPQLAHAYDNKACPLSVACR